MAYGMRDLISLVEGSDLSQLEQIKRIAASVRAEFDAYYGANDEDSFWSVGNCRDAAKTLCEALVAAGFQAEAVFGTYLCCDPSYPEIVAKHSADGLDPEDDLADWDGSWVHWWVKCRDVIVDITADQFHPSERTDYRVVVTPKTNSCYRSRKTAKVTRARSPTAPNR
jgi:hypothetical protein